MDTISEVNTTNKTLLWIIGGCLAILICLCLAIFIVFGGLVWLGSKTPENATYQLDMPAQAQLGEPFQFSIQVDNTSSETIELNSVDFSMNFLDGIIIEETDPSYTTTDGYNSLGESYMTYYFERPIAPGESLTIVFDAKGISTGDYSGDVDVCIDTEFNCITNTARIVISE